VKKRILAVVFTCTALTGCASNIRLTEANAFKDAVTSADYETALSHTSLNQYDYLSGDTFGEVLYTSGWYDYFNSFGQYSKVKYDKDTLTESLTDDTGNTMTWQLDENGLIVFDDWTLFDIDINVPAGSSLYIDDEYIDTIYESGTYDGITTYTMPVVFNTTLNLKTSNSLFGDVEKSFTYTGDTIDMTIVSDEATENILSQLNSKITRIYNCVVYETDPSEILTELPQLGTIDDAKDFIKRIKSNQRLDDAYTCYTDINATCTLTSSMKFIGENKVELPVKMEVSFNMGNKPALETLYLNLDIDYSNNEFNFTNDTDLKFFYNLMYSEED
jgi:hypothetical protein